jgi:N-acetyltransferase 10
MRVALDSELVCLQNALPDVLAVVQVALEGAISRTAAMTNLAQGQLPSGDLIPWTLGQQFQDPEFPRLSGARVVRIAVHPDLQRAGCACAIACAIPSGHRGGA